MDKEILIQYCDLKQEIAKLEGRIGKIHKQSEIISDVVQNGYKRHAVVRGYDYRRKHKLERLECILQERHDRLLELQIKIEEWIDTIEKSNIRRIFQYRYIDNMSWIQVQLAMGYGDESTARKAHDKFLEENL